MAILLITYDLHEKPAKEYDEFYKVIKSYQYKRLSESSYAINATDTVKAIYDKLFPIVGTTDKFYIITLTKPFQGFGLDDVNKWLEQNLLAGLWI